MNKDMWNRLLTAGKYQKMAMEALLPERAAGHLDVIGREIKAMMWECVTDMGKRRLSDYGDTFWENNASSPGSPGTAGQGTVKKVDID